MRLEAEIAAARSGKDILLMTHIVLGYPSFAVNRAVIEQMVKNGVDVIEMQIPFSEPIADGSVILQANQAAIAAGVRVRDCLAFAEEMTSTYGIPFLFMTYYNIPYKYGVEEFCARAAKIGIRGLIIPDLPPEEAGDYYRHAAGQGLAHIPIFAPTSTEERMKFLAGKGAGFIYCVARRGVTGKKTAFDESFDTYLARCRRSTALPLAVGFGINSREDVRLLAGKADLAVIGTATIKLVDEQGPGAVGPFIASLRGETA